MADIDFEGIFRDLPSHLSNAVATLASNGPVLAAIGGAALALGAVFHAAMFAVDVLAAAAALPFRAAAFLAGGAVSVVVAVFGAAMGAAFRVAMWTGAAVTHLLIAGASSTLGALGGNAKILAAAATSGGALGAVFQAAFVVGLAVVVATAIDQLGTALGQMGKDAGLPTGGMPWWIRDMQGPEGEKARADWHRRNPGNASGTRNWPGGMSWVGERGPELVNLPKGSDVYSAPQSQAMGRGGSSYTINVSAATSSPAEVGRAVVEAIRAFERRDGRAWRAT